jgi:glycosylphosphatidylinositol transamidase
MTFCAQDPSPLLTLLAVVAHQAPGLPLSNHALFLTHRIDSVTVRGVAGGTARNLRNLGRALEGTFRSVNNLLETLHHSEFFYFTISNWRFVSIGQFMPLIGFLIAPVVLEISLATIIYSYS